MSCQFICSSSNYLFVFQFFSSDTSILLDCGEGSVGQMCRLYGERTEDIIRSIKALHITHMHGDHHMGVMDFIRMRQKCMPENRPPLLVMAPLQPFEQLLNFYEQHFGSVRDEITLINNADLVREKGRLRSCSRLTRRILLMWRIWDFPGKWTVRWLESRSQCKWSSNLPSRTHRAIVRDLFENECAANGECWTARGIQIDI